MTDTPPRPIPVLRSTLMDAPPTDTAVTDSGDMDFFADDLLASPPTNMMLPGVNVIGCGVDVLHGNYATGSSTKRQLFKISERIYPEDYEGEEDPFRRDRANAYAQCERLYGKSTYGLLEVEPRISSESHKHTSSGTKIASVQSELSASAKISGSYGTFSGEVEVLGSQTHASTASSYFCQILGRFPKYVLRLIPQDDDLWNLLRPEVQDALGTWPADKLKSDFFPKYGGYYLHNGVVGGCVKYWAVRNKTSTEDSTSFETNMAASYKYGIGEAKGEAHVAGSKTNKTFQDNCVNDLFARGGTKFPDFGTEGAVNDWIETILDAPELIDFDDGNGDGCRPVWSLIEDPTRAAQVEAAFTEYAVENGRIFDVFDPDLQPLYGFRDWNTKGLHRWFYTLNADQKRGKEWGNAYHKHMHVYANAQFGVTKFTAVAQEIGSGFLKGKHHIYKIVKGGTPANWKHLSTFYAPTKPLTGSLDTWVPIYEYTRKEDGDKCGQHYNTKDASGVSKWSRSAKPLFYAAKK